MQARVRLGLCPRNPLRRSRVSSARNAGESAICPVCAQPSAEIVRVECAKCRRECELTCSRATLCGDRACRVRAMQARVRFLRCARNPRVRLGLCARNPLQRSCASSARNAGENAIGSARAQPSAEIVRVERAKRRRECDWVCARATHVRNAGESAIGSCRHWRLSSTTLVRGVSGELEDENWRLCSTTLVRGVSGELEDENWRLCTTTLVRGAICGAGS